jgi:hypothetical protein
MESYNVVEWVDKRVLPLLFLFLLQDTNWEAASLSQWQTTRRIRRESGVEDKISCLQE